MSSTTVHSNTQEKNKKASIAASGIYLTENSLEVPKDAKKVHEIITSYIEEQGNMEIPAGNATIKENGEMKLENGKIVVVAPEAMKVLAKQRKAKKEMKEKATTRNTARVLNNEEIEK